LEGKCGQSEPTEFRESSIKNGQKGGNMLEKEKAPKDAIVSPNINRLKRRRDVGGGEGEMCCVNAWPGE
jgi:hypothetical protein